MAFLSHRRFVDDGAQIYYEEVSFIGASLEEADTELRQWLIRTMPLGTNYLQIDTKYATKGKQHYITLSYTSYQKVKDRVEPKGLLRSTELS